MIVGVLTIDLTVPEAQSLKDKRRIVRSLKDGLRNRFNVSVAEVEYQDMPRRCRLGIATVSCESRVLHARMDKMVELVRRTAGASLVDYQREFL